MDILAKFKKKKANDFVHQNPYMRKEDERYYAHELISNPVYEKVMETLKEEYRQRWEQSHSSDYEMREEFYQYIRVLKQIDTRFRGMVSEAVSDEQLRQFMARQAQEAPQ